MTTASFEAREARQGDELLDLAILENMTKQKDQLSRLGKISLVVLTASITSAFWLFIFRGAWFPQN